MARRRSILRRVLPGPVVDGMRAVRQAWRELRDRLAPSPSKHAFILELPRSGNGGSHSRTAGTFRWRSVPALTRVWIDVPRSLYVGGVLRRAGLRGYEPATISCFLASLQATECRLAFDIGANVGVFTLVGAALTPTRIVAFEPEPIVAAALARTIRLNRLAATTEAVAVGDRDGVATLFISDTTDASNSLNPEFRHAVGTIDVPLVSLDTYCRRTGSWPQVVKIDTETTEPAVLRGGSELLGRRPWIVCEILTVGAAQEIEEILGPLGYRWYQIREPLPPLAVERIVGHESIEVPNWLLLPGAAPPGLWDDAAEWRRRIEGPTTVS